MKVALIGLDGSGKSANINLMKKDNDYKEFKFLWVRWQPSITLWIKKLKHKHSEVSTGPRTYDVEGQKKQASLVKEYQNKSKVKNILFGNEFIRRIWMGYAIKDYRKQFYKKTQGILSDNSNVIFDRYYLDLFVDQGINFGYSPEKVYSEIFKYKDYFPTMDRIIYINVSPDVCFSRKDDIPNMQYLQKRFDIYNYMAKKDNWLIVDGEKPLEEVYQTIKNAIIG